MVKKVVKKVKKPIAKPAAASESLEMPMTSTLDADDVAEDHKVFDMSDIAAPIIEFEMPNLTERKFEKEAPEEENEEEEEDKKSVKTTKKPAQKVKKSAISAKKEILTAEKLNNELVKLRVVVVKSKNQLMPKLLRQKKKLEARGKSSSDSERKVARITEEIVGLKQFDKDSVAKFAALNTKSLNELKITDKTPVAERLMYKLACQPVVVEQMDVVREKYTEWSRTAAFFMQRLGLQYANKPQKEAMVQDDTEEDEGQEEAQKASKESDDGEQEVGQEEGDDGADTDDADVAEDDYNESDVEMVDSDEESEATAEKRRKLLLGLIDVKEDKSRPKLAPKKRKIVDDDVATTVEKKAPKSMKMEMAEIFKKELGTKEVQKPTKSKKSAPKSAPKKVTEKKESVKEEEEEVPEDTNQKTLVIKVDLSKGGKIGKLSKTEAPPTKKNVPEPIQKDDDVDDDEDGVGFFLPKTSSAVTKAAPKASKTMKVSKTPKIPKAQAPPTKLAPKNAPKPQEPLKKKGSSKNSVAGEVHPSWAASQLKKKEMLAAKPCGKKITFGDD